MKKLLLTGGSGLLAVNWTRLLGDTWSVHLALNNRLIRPFGAQGRVLDLSSAATFDSLLSSFDPDLVVHTAGLTNIELCEAQPELARRVNVELTENVAQCCFNRRVKMVHISTDHLFAGTESFRNETAEPAPVNVYARTKADAEAAVATLCPDALVVRTNFYGWGPSYRRSFSDTIIDTLRQGKDINLFDDVYFTPVVVDILVESVHRLVDGGLSGTFHVVGDERLSKFEFGLKIANRFGLDHRLVKAGKITERAGLVRRPLDMSLCNAKARAATGTQFGNVADHLDMLFSLEHTPRVQELQRL